MTINLKHISALSRLNGVWSGCEPLCVSVVKSLHKKIKIAFVFIFAASATFQFICSSQSSWEEAQPEIVHTLGTTQGRRCQCCSVNSPMQLNQQALTRFYARLNNCKLKALREAATMDVYAETFSLFSFHFFISFREKLITR